MSSEETRSAFTPTTLLGLFLASLIVSIGTVWAFRPGGGGDFRVFYEAWRHVLVGQGELIYRETPDRFLYAPGFAWLLSPLARLPFHTALALWCLAKAAVIGYVVREFGRERGLGLAAWGTLLFARPLLIDFQYGQVNSFILGACVWALARHALPASASASPRSVRAAIADVASWMVLAAAALAKLFPLPLAIVPLAPVADGVPRTRRLRELAGLAVGFALIAVVPFVALGPEGGARLYAGWRDALVSRGLPLESHNQSFAAFLHHWFSGEPTEIIAMHRRSLHLGGAWLAPETIELLTLAWSFMTMGFLIAWAWLRPPGRAPYAWMAVVIGLLVVPSHLIWKPYFVLSLPLGMVALAELDRRFTAAGAALLALVFAAVNLSGYDVTGPSLGATLEATPVLLTAHLALLLWVARRWSPQVRPRSARPDHAAD